MERIWKVCILLVLIILTSCRNKDEVIKGYLVYKEYVPAHMDNENPTSVSHLIIIVPHTVHHRRTPQKVEEAWYWYIANKKEVFKKRVSSQFFNSKHCGDKVIIYKYKQP